MRMEEILVVNLMKRKRKEIKRRWHEGDKSLTPSVKYMMKEREE